MDKFQFHFLLMLGTANLAVSTIGIIHWILWGFTSLFMAFSLLDCYSKAKEEEKLRQKGQRVIRF